MATIKNQRIAALCGGFNPPNQVEALRNDVRYDSTGVARALGVPLQHYLNAVAENLPVQEKPLNWTSVNAPCAAHTNILGVDYFGVAAVVYAHAWWPGYTWGAPAFINVQGT